MSTKTDGLQVVRRAIKLTKLVAEMQRSGARPTDLARCAGLNVATTSRLLRGLTEERLLQFDPRTRSYRMGPLAYELGLAARREVHLINRYRSLLQSVADEAGETAYLVARSDTEAVCLGYVAATSAIRAIPFETGDRLPLGIGAGSLSLLSALGDEEIERVLAENEPLMAAFGPHASLTELKHAVARTRREGYAFTSNMHIPGLANSTFRTAGVGLNIPASAHSPAQVAIGLAFVMTGESHYFQEEFASILRKKIADFAGSQSSK